MPFDFAGNRLCAVLIVSRRFLSVEMTRDTFFIYFGIVLGHAFIVSVPCDLRVALGKSIRACWNTTPIASEFGHP
jgi:hypothetical protein